MAGLAFAAITAMPVGALAHDDDSRTVIERFQKDPAKGDKKSKNPEDRTFVERGTAPEAFSYEGKTKHRFEHDEDGSLMAVFDSNAPTERFYTTFTGGYTQADDFSFGAAFTIRPEGFAADPFGGSSISFGLFNSQTTGDNRTGDLDNFASNSFDTVEVDYFANQGSFGGPFLCPTVLGSKISGDAFTNIGFGCTEVELTPGVPYLVWADHDAQARTLAVRVYQLGGKGEPTEITAARVTINLAPVSGFNVDSFGVFAYRDGYSTLTPSGRSLFAVTDFDALAAGSGAGDHKLRDFLKHLKIEGKKK